MRLKTVINIIVALAVVLPSLAIVTPASAATTPTTRPLVQYWQDANGAPVIATTKLLSDVSDIRQPGVSARYAGTAQLFTSQQPGTHAIYSCKTPVDYMLSVLSNCEGYGAGANLGIEGWAYDSQPVNTNTQTLYRCYNVTLGKHFVDDFPNSSLDCQTDSRYTVQREGIIGYAPSIDQAVATRYDNGHDSQFTAGSAGYNNGSYGYMAEKQWILQATSLPSDSSRAMLYNCWYYTGSGAANYFPSTRSDCEGSNNAGPVGYLYASQPAEPSTALYRCYNSSRTDHFISDTATCEGRAGAHVEGMLGYALLRN